MPPNHLICLPHLLLPSTFPNIRVSSSELALHIRWSKHQSFSISPSDENSGLISFRIDCFDLLTVQGTFKSLPAPQFKSFNSSALILLYGPTLTTIYDYWKSHSFDCMDLCQPRASLKRKCSIMGVVTSPGWFFFLPYVFVISSVFFQ